jgi:hypothetical protein
VRPKVDEIAAGGGTPPAAISVKFLINGTIKELQQ